MNATETLVGAVVWYEKRGTGTVRVRITRTWPNAYGTVWPPRDDVDPVPGFDGVMVDEMGETIRPIWGTLDRVRPLDPCPLPTDN